MDIHLFNFMEDNKTRFAAAIRERMRAHVPESEMSNEALDEIVAEAFEAFVDLSVTDEIDQFVGVHRKLVSLAAVQPTRLAGLLHLYLVMADAIRASFAEQIMKSDVDVSARVGRGLLSLDPHAGQATRALFDAFHEEFSRSTVPSTST